MLIFDLLCKVIVRFWPLSLTAVNVASIWLIWDYGVSSANSFQCSNIFRRHVKPVLLLETDGLRLSFSVAWAASNLSVPRLSLAWASVSENLLYPACFSLSKTESGLSFIWSSLINFLSWRWLSDCSALLLPPVPIDCSLTIGYICFYLFKICRNFWHPRSLLEFLGLFQISLSLTNLSLFQSSLASWAFWAWEFAWFWLYPVQFDLFELLFSASFTASVWLATASLAAFFRAEEAWVPSSAVLTASFANLWHLLWQCLQIFLLPWLQLPFLTCHFDLSYL